METGSLFERMVKSGNVKSIEEAKRQPRYLYCPCKKCNHVSLKKINYAI